MSARRLLRDLGWLVADLGPPFLNWLVLVLLFALIVYAVMALPALAG